MFATQVLPDFPANDSSEEENATELVGYIIVNDKKFEVNRGETKIGRDSLMCSIVIDNFTVSKVHAVIESEGIDDTFIYDVGSTNQTKLGKKVLKPHCRYKLGDESKLTFGNIMAKFILPPDKTLNSNLEKGGPNPVYLNPLDELGDIFDIATQVTAAQSSSSSVTIAFEKNSDTIRHFKSGKSVVFTEVEKTPEIPKSVFDVVTQCKLDSEKKTSRAVHLMENSGIFNLSTQFQLCEPSIVQNEKSDVEVLCDNKNSESDKLTALLNDGQDDVLCTLMSSHSPKEQCEELTNEVRDKVDVNNISLVSNKSQGSLEVGVVQEPGECSEIKSNDVVESKDLNKHFLGGNLCKPSITSTPINRTFKSKHNNNLSNTNSNSTHMEEEFIKTQEFNVDGLIFSEKYKNSSNNMGSNSCSKKYQPNIQEAFSNVPTAEQEDDEDLTQAFEPLKEHSNEEAPTVIPESEDIIGTEDDYIQTQIYEIEKSNNNAEKDILKEREFERLDENAKCHFNDTMDFTQRNNEDDFISTQVFEEATADKRNDSSDDEDFICTQPVKFPVLEPRNSRNCRNVEIIKKSTEVETISRESSPDLLGTRGSWKNNEDCIATQIFEFPECQNPASTCTEGIEQTSSDSPHQLESEKHKSVISHTKIPDIVDSSGDETESDLEILLDKNETRRNKKSGESTLSSLKVEPDSEECIQAGRSITPENNSNASYIFALEPENHLEDVGNNEPNQKPLGQLSDSDATDCEELAFVPPEISLKQEPLNEVDDTLRLPTTTPNVAEKTDDSSDDWMTGKESPKFEMQNENSPMSPLSLEMPNTQDVEITMNRLLESEKREDCERPSKIKKTEVGIKKSGESNAFESIEPFKRQIDSPLKRPLDNNTNATDIVPPKKTKIETLDRFLKSIEKQFSKLVQTHDIGQIQPSRTRNSLKVLSKENNFNKTDNYLGSNIINEGPTSRRKASTKRRSTKKVNGDIKPFLTQKTEAKRSLFGGGNKETSPEESKSNEGSFRILRSSRKNCGSAVPVVLAESPTNNVRRSKRNSRARSGEYFRNTCVNVVFTGFDCVSLDNIIYSLGGKKTNDISCCEVVVADKIRRTVKFLCAVGLSLPITSPQWLLSCQKEKKFINPWNFILQDEESEEKWNFNLKSSLERSKNTKLLQGFSVYATKSIQPPVKDLLVIVECCGGTPISQPPDVWPKNTIVVSCLEDKKWWPLAKRNVKIVHYEFILSGVLKQKIDFKTYKLR